VLHPVNDGVEAVESDGRRGLRCCECQQDLGGYGDEFKQSTVMRETPLLALSPLNRWCDTRFVAREFFCPGCALSLAVDIQDKSEPVLDDGHFFQL
jgi:acetone carboxylase gamma subunit